MEHHPSHKSPTAFVNEEAAGKSGEKLSFSFGANWQRFVVDVDDQMIDAAVESFCRFTKMDGLQGETFLDAGCGTGHIAVGVAHKFPHWCAFGIDLSSARAAAAP